VLLAFYWMVTGVRYVTTRAVAPDADRLNQLKSLQ